MPSLLVFESSDVVKRFEKMGDLFEPVLELKQKLPDLKAAVPAASESQPVQTAPIEIAAQAGDGHAPGKAARKKSGKKSGKKGAAGKKRAKV